jgi:hypothetical protein
VAVDASVEGVASAELEPPFVAVPESADPLSPLETPESSSVRIS